MSYKLLSVEGSGAYGTVVKGRDLRRGRKIVALKVLREDHLDNPRVLCRTRDEARMLIALDHPNIVKVYDLDERWGRPVIVMEWLEAYSLGDLMDSMKRPFPLGVACELIAWSAEALEHAWTRTQGDPPRPMNLVHRDLKPNNMLLTLGGELKLVDFGLAHGDFDGKESDTVSMVLGTRAYMSPERLDGAPDEPAADVYALGLILMELMLGRSVSMSLNPRRHAVRLEDALNAIAELELAPPAMTRLLTLLRGMLEYEPEDRPSHLEVAKTLKLVLAMGSLSPDIHAFAREYVKPLVVARRQVPPEDHEDYAEIKFLEGTPLMVDQQTIDDTVNPEVLFDNDKSLRELLASRRWISNLVSIKKILGTGEHTAAPFLEVMDAALAPVVPGSEQADPRLIAMCLNVLRGRPSDEVLKRAERLCRYPDDLVRRTAEQYLDVAGLR